MLNEQKLLTELRKFKDPSYSGFKDFPNGKPQARKFWGAAFYTYVKDMACTVPAGTSDPSKTPVTSGTAKAFESTLLIPDMATAETAAADYSNAWFTSMMTIVLKPGGNYAGNPINTILTITPLAAFIAAQKPILYAALLVIFKDIQPKDHLTQLKKIVKAFHAATKGAGGPTACTYKIIPPPFVMAGTLKYE